MEGLQVAAVCCEDPSALLERPGFCRIAELE